MTTRSEAKKRFAACGFGVATHWLASPGLSAEAWERRVARFDAQGLASQLAEAGAGHLLFTLGQNSGHYAAPNATYALLSAVLPCKCSSRDLISDLHAELAPRGVRLFVYLPSGGPAQDEVACRALGWEWGYEVPWPKADPALRTGKRLAGFQVKWEAVVREWSLRWGRKVDGWWIDGCCFAEAMYRNLTPPHFDSLAAALRAGNPDALLAFNPGARFPLAPFAPCEDYTAGESSGSLPEISASSFAGDKAKPVPHVLSYLGAARGRGEAPRFPDALVAAYTDYVGKIGGVVTWDVPVDSRGTIAGNFMKQLLNVGEVTANRRGRDASDR